ncbi:MAG: fasciclin domain-containing protein [Planctomycetes bacterium]|nr:fasciclin domain-containing protein [Planctomycetota bacterium]
MRRLVSTAFLLLAACGTDTGNATQKPTDPKPATPAVTTPPPLDPNNIVSIAIGSKDHKTLVAALQAANYVASVANPGPLTVFAPTDAAFGKLPAGTVEGLVEPDKQADLKEILKYHVAAAVYDEATLKGMAGKQLGMANGKKVAITVVDGKLKINDATVVATVRASNGIVHVVDGVLLPPAN